MIGLDANFSSVTFFRDFVKISEKELIQKIAGHVSNHGIKDIIPDLAAKVKSKIKDQ